MHYHMEIILSKDLKEAELEAAIEAAMKPYCEHDCEPGAVTFWDLYELGGRFSGKKARAFYGDVIEKMYVWCKEEGITCSGVQMGKQSLSPPSQIPKVDAKWQELTGTGGACLLFEHAGARLPGDIGKVRDLHEDLTAATVLIGDKFLVQDEVWNGNHFQKTSWDGSVSGAIKLAAEHYPAVRVEPEDWCVTVDYHC